MKDEALKLALEALERGVATCFDRYSHEQVMCRPEHFINQAIAACEQALAALVQERNFCERCGKRLGSGIHTCTPPETEKNT
jgi:hypothetical protein